MSENNVNITIANRLATAHDKMTIALQKADRQVNDVSLIAVSKTMSFDKVQQAYDAGQRKFGENYAQELQEKAQQLQSLPGIEWHFIGPIQSNKTAIVAQHAHWVDSIDRIKIAKRLEQHCQALGKKLNILVQVNISQSPSKAGIPLQDVDSFIDELREFKSLTVRGLMAIPDAYEDKSIQNKEFQALHTCFLQLQHKHISIDTLSLGMTADMQDAILFGSTMIRLGTAIFGPRVS